MGAFSLIVVINLLNRINAIVFAMSTFCLTFARQVIRQKSTRITGKLMSRPLHLSKITRHGDFEWHDAESEDQVVNITYVNRDGTESNIRGKVGDNVMYLAHRHEIDIEGACEASLACSTCHVIVDPNYFNMLKEPEEEEDDMLDLAPALTSTSRLGCQIILDKKLDGIKVTLPPITRNFYVDGHKPQPH